MTEELHALRLENEQLKARGAGSGIPARCPRSRPPAPLPLSPSPAHPFPRRLRRPRARRCRAATTAPPPSTEARRDPPPRARRSAGAAHTRRLRTDRSSGGGKGSPRRFMAWRLKREPPGSCTKQGLRTQAGTQYVQGRLPTAPTSMRCPIGSETAAWGPSEAARRTRANSHALWTIPRTFPGRDPAHEMGERSWYMLSSREMKN